MAYGQPGNIAHDIKKPLGLFRFRSVLRCRLHCAPSCFLTMAATAASPTAAFRILTWHLSATSSHAASGTDVPPILSSATIWSPIPQPTEIGCEEAFYRRADHRLPARSGSRHGGEGSMPQARLQRSLVLPVAQQVRRHDGARGQAA